MSKQNVSLTLDKTLVTNIDRERGDVKRSTMIEGILSDFFGDVPIVQEIDGQNVLKVRTKQVFVDKCVEYRKATGIMDTPSGKPTTTASHLKNDFYARMFFNKEDFSVVAARILFNETNLTEFAKRKFVAFQKHDQHDAKSKIFPLRNFLLVETPEEYQEFIPTPYAWLLVGE